MRASSTMPSALHDQRCPKGSSSGAAAVTSTAMLSLQPGQVDLSPVCPESDTVARRLGDKVSGILERIERELDQADEEIGNKLRYSGQAPDTGSTCTHEVLPGSPYRQCAVGVQDCRSCCAGYNCCVVTDAQGHRKRHGIPKSAYQHVRFTVCSLQGRLATV